MSWSTSTATPSGPHTWQRRWPHGSLTTSSTNSTPSALRRSASASTSSTRKATIAPAAARPRSAAGSDSWSRSTKSRLTPAKSAEVVLTYQPMSMLTAKPKCSANQPAHRAGSATDNAKPITFLVCIELLSKQRHTEYYGQSTTCIVFSVPDESPNPWHAPTSPADAHYWTPPSTSSPTTAPAASLTAPSTP